MSANTTAVLILGMHRSGTSCLAGSLQQAGLELGKVFTKNSFNAKGNRENKQVMELNEEVLEFSGGAWDVPPAELRWSDAQAARRDRILAGLAARAERSWGFKDPRALLTLGFWRASGVEFEYIGTIRHPLSVARSLEARSGMSLERGYGLWSAYNQRLLELHDEREFPVLSFDAPEAQYLERVRRVVSELGLDVRSSDAPFFEGALRRQSDAESGAPGALPAEVERLYRRLIELSEPPDPRPGGA